MRDDTRQITSCGDRAQDLGFVPTLVPTTVLVPRGAKFVLASLWPAVLPDYNDLDWCPTCEIFGLYWSRFGPFLSHILRRLHSFAFSQDTFFPKKNVTYASVTYCGVTYATVTYGVVRTRVRPARQLAI